LIGSSNNKELLALLLPLVRKQARYLFLAAASTLIATISMLAMPWFVRDFVDNMLASGFDGLARISLILLVLFLVQGSFSGIQAYLVAKAGQGIVYDLMVRVYSRLQRFPTAIFDREHTGELVSRIVNDTSVIRRSVSNNVVEWITQIFSAVGAVVLMFVLDWRLTLAAVIAVPAALATAMLLGKRVRSASSDTQQSLADITSTMNENLSGIRVVKSFAREDHEAQRFADGATRVYENSMRQARLTAVLRPLILFTILGATFAVLYYGSIRVAAGELAAGDLVAFLLYIFILAGPAGGLSSLYAELQQALAAAERVFSLLDRPIEGSDPEATHLGYVDGRVEFVNVSFSYEDDQEVLKGVSLKVDPGETVALVGPSGAGKTTLVSLLARFYELDSGYITVDKKDVREVTLKSLRSSIGFVAQDIFLFSGTVKDNIRYGNISASDEEIEEAAKAANAHDFIRALPEAYDTLVGERGVTLSGGQRQRVAIARTLLSDPAILVLDEATSNLDTESEALIQEAISRLMYGRTTFVIAHRLSTVIAADKIVVLEAGEIVAQGTHEQLILSNTLYRRLYDRRFEEVS